MKYMLTKAVGYLNIVSQDQRKKLEHDTMFCYALLFSNSSFASILKRKRKLVALLLLFYRCTTTVNVMWLFLTMS